MCLQEQYVADSCAIKNKVQVKKPINQRVKLNNAKNEVSCICMDSEIPNKVSQL